MTIREMHTSCKPWFIYMAHSYNVEFSNIEIVPQNFIYIIYYLNYVMPKFENNRMD